MTGSKILWGQMLAALLGVLGSCWLATEWTARQLAFQPALGGSWLTAWNWPIYQPHLFFAWWYRFGGYAPGAFLQGALIASGTVAGVVEIRGGVISGLCNEPESALRRRWRSHHGEE